jgi:hypothetical protein
MDVPPIQRLTLGGLHMGMSVKYAQDLFAERVADLLDDPSSILSGEHPAKAISDLRIVALALELDFDQLTMVGTSRERTLFNDIEEGRVPAKV